MTEHLSDEQLNALADSIRLDLPIDAEHVVRAHLDECGECRARFGKLARMLESAESMPRRVEPPADLWPSIKGRIVERGSSDEHTPYVSEEASRPSTRSPALGDVTMLPWHARPRLRVVVGLAAALVLAVLFGSRAGGWLSGGSHGKVAGLTAESSSTGPRSATAVVPASGIAASDSEQLRVEEELLAALELRRSALPPSTTAQIDSSLRVIDAAIAELEAARARDPNNPVIRQLLATSRARKLELLKQAQDAS
jgi:hypothetical protein